VIGQEETTTCMGKIIEKFERSEVGTKQKGEPRVAGNVQMIKIFQE
jgi:hypothetical protein